MLLPEILLYTYNMYNILLSHFGLVSCPLLLSWVSSPWAWLSFCFSSDNSIFSCVGQQYILILFSIIHPQQKLNKNSNYVSSKSIYPLPHRKCITEWPKGNSHTISGFTKCCYTVMISHVFLSLINWYRTHAVCTQRL